MNNTQKYSLALTFALLMGILASSSAFVTVPAAAQGNKDWPMFRYDAANTGYNPNSVGPYPITLKWSYETGGIVRSSPAIVNQKVYIGSDDGKLYCLDGNTGEELWTYQAENAIRSSPAVVGGKVYFGSYDTNVYCVDANSGSLVWTFKTNYTVPGSPNVVNNRVYIVSNDNKAYCLDALTGTKIWEYLTEGSLSSVRRGGYESQYQNMKPAVVDDRVFFGWLDNYVYCLNATTGVRLWRLQGSSAPSTASTSAGARGFRESSPMVVNGAVYIGGQDTRWRKINATNGTPIWTMRYHEALGVASPSDNIIQNSACWPNDGYVYYIYPNPHMACQVNPATGMIVNMGMMGILPRSSLSGAGDYLYCGNNDRYLYVWLKDTMARMQSFDVPQIIESTPSLADDKVYVGCNDRVVRCFEHGEPKSLNHLTADPSVRTLPLGRPITVTGAITPYHLNGPEGQTVTLHFVRPDGTTATATTTTGAAGIYSGTYTPDAEGQWKVKAAWEGNPWWEPSQSVYQTFTVTAAQAKTPTTMSIALSNTTIFPDHSITVSGNINPAVAGQTVTLTYTRPDGSSVTRTSVSASAGAYTDTYRPDAEGNWNVKSSWAGTDEYEAATSSTSAFTVSQAEQQPTGGGLAISMEIIYAIVAIIAIIIVAAAAYLFLRKKK